MNPRLSFAAIAVVALAACPESGEFIDPDTHGSLYDANIFAETAVDLGDAGKKAAFGEPCTDSTQCQSKLCLKGCTGYACSKKCSKGTASCGTGYGCVGGQRRHRARSGGLRLRAALRGRRA